MFFHYYSNTFYGFIRIVRLIDTKLMASTKPFRDAIPNSALEPLLKTLSKPPFNMGEVCMCSSIMLI
jgi:hypothetical protein